MTPTEKANLLNEWIKRKKAESDAKKKRIEIEEKIIPLYGINFDGKSKTFKENDIGFSVNLQKNIKFDLDQDRWKEFRQLIPEELRPEKIIFALDISGFNFLKGSKEHKDIYKMVSDCVTEKENKVVVKVEKI
jgi:hypothetical protein